MKFTKRAVGFVVLMSLLCVGVASAEHTVNKKKKVTVTVEQDSNCVHGISVSDANWGDRQLCTDYPDGAADHLQQYVGSRVELEAQFTFDSNPKNNPPIGILKVYQVAGDHIYDPCAIGKVGMFAAVMLAANGADPTATVASMTPGCPANANQ